MSDDMVERVARALCREQHIQRYGSEMWREGELDQKVEGYWRHHIIGARAAIAAMREPTEAMIGAANRNNHPRDIDTWKTMVDEALK